MAVDPSRSQFDVGGLSRHAYVYEGTNGELALSVPERLPHLEIINGEFPLVHVCRGGEYLVDLAQMYYREVLSRPVDAWEIIAQFQEDPVTDGFVPLKRGQVVLIPPPAYFSMVVYGESLSEMPEM